MFALQHWMILFHIFFKRIKRRPNEKRSIIFYDHHVEFRSEWWRTCKHSPPCGIKQDRFHSTRNLRPELNHLPTLRFLKIIARLYNAEIIFRNQG